MLGIHTVLRAAEADGIDFQHRPTGVKGEAVNTRRKYTIVQQQAERVKSTGVSPFCLKKQGFLHRTRLLCVYGRSPERPVDAGTRGTHSVFHALSQHQLPEYTYSAYLCQLIYMPQQSRQIHIIDKRGVL